MSFFTPTRPLLLSWLLSFTAWGLVALLLGSAQLLEHHGSAMAIVRSALHTWLPWAILTPLLFGLTLRLPLDREHWTSALPTHLLVAIAVLAGLHWWRDLEHHEPHGGMGPPHGSADWDEPHGPYGPPPGPPPDFDDHAPPDSAGGSWRLLRSDLPIYLMLLSSAHAALFFRREKERAASLAQARLDALRMQLQPHFLFNCLNTIAGLVHEDPERAENMIVALSELLRLTLANAGEAELPLARELEFVERYLALMHARFEDKLTFELQAEPELRTALIPSFLLQPLVEEAVQQELQLNRRGGRVAVRVWRAGEQLRLSVAAGCQAVALTRPAAESPGLQHARERLRQLYGKHGTLLVDQSDGCIVEIALPLHTFTQS